MGRRMKRYDVPITFLFLLILATGVYGDNDDQPECNITMFGSYFLVGRTAFGIGGAVGILFTPRLELEGEIYTIPAEGGVYIVSEGVLYNFDNGTKNAIQYVVGGFSQFIVPEGTTIGLMFGGGLKMPLTRSFKIRLDFRIHLFDEGWLMRLSTGLMWTF
ncbi:MAG: hypothetical protein OEZ30_02565 [Candidatus Aminicenantes bacterium]|nr:hypothetical protein [Candidatus Aminicenantes bacterium]